MTDMPAQEPGHAAWSAGGDATFRELMSLFPSGVTVVTAIDRTGVPLGLTCTSMCSVSLSPPMLLTCLHHRSSTLHAMLERGSFAVNLLHSGGQAAAEVFATADLDRFAAVRWQPTPVRGLPWLTTDAHAVAECEVAEAKAAGDHVVVFGHVDGVLTRPGSPLLYGLRSYAAWTGRDGTPTEGTAEWTPASTVSSSSAGAPLAG
ncbi:flavin reductase family protein [Micromonospora echinofusca]|uniref:Flavin reductase n=1 Tax=Micromonospora echinofusca TaxID=47858 RepID=A0ABS3VNF5_MICEH|nr:flavin reductase family protein [Micromonospora echinofusca]MBO4206021.1 flavin reductase [Micromonospora echinofusca]